MKNSDQDTIDSFLKGELSNQEKDLFFKKMLTDPDLKKEVMEQMAALQFVEKLGDAQLKALIAETLAEAKTKTPPENRPSYKIAYTAILLLVLSIVAAISIYYLNRLPKAERLYAAYYQAYTLPLVSRGANTDSLLNLAADHYLKKEYSQVVPLLQSILSTEPDNSKLRLALGISQIETEKYAAALSSFQTLIETKDPLYYHQACWYSALTHLKLHDMLSCRKMLQPLLDDQEAVFHGEAVLLMEGL